MGGVRERGETRFGRGIGKGKRFDDESKRCCFDEQATILLLIAQGSSCVARRASKRRQIFQVETQLVKTQPEQT